MSRGSDPEKRQEWAARLERFRHSGQTVAQFCRTEQVGVPSFYQWRRKLGKSSKSKAAGRPRGKRRPSRQTEGSNFKPLEVVATQNLAGATIRLSNGIVIEIGGDPRMLKQVVSQLLDHGSSRGEMSGC